MANDIAAPDSHPILFSGSMVRAILEKRKSQTRRVLNPQPLPGRRCVHSDGKRWYTRDIDPPGSPIDHGDWKCPYGLPGDQLWVRECWANSAQVEAEDPGIVYRASDPDWSSYAGWRWKPSIHMPHAASRITLEITAVRVELLHSISDGDVVAEGVEQRHIDKNRPFFDTRDVHALAFAELWDASVWKANPWVWVLEFQRMPHVGRVVKLTK